MKINRISDYTVVGDLLDNNAIVLDLGGNHGNFTNQIYSQYKCRCFVVEANPILADSLTKDSTRHVLHAAAAGTSGHITFYVNECDTCSTVIETTGKTDNSKTVVVPALTYADILNHFGIQHVDLLKLDIEGSEIEFLDSIPDHQLKQIKQITIEFHDFMGVYPRSEVKRVLRRLARLGFRNLSEQWGRYDVLMVNLSRCSFVKTTHVLRAACRRVVERAMRWRHRKTFA